MQSYKLKYHKNSLLLITMIGFPIVCATIMFAFLSNLPQSLPEWAMLIMVCSSLVLMVAFLFWMINTQLIVRCAVKVNDKGINLKIDQPSLFYKPKDFFAGWENVNHITEKFDGRNGSYYYQVSFKNPSFNANFNALNGGEEEAEKFYTELRYFQETYSLNKLPKQRKQEYSPNIWV
ncbi:hypothetical protein ACFOG5_16865 [Pedobacter fastidiosus]|uniref:PH domain-containing protein n=1 Tax=Pedobacter fastidiosus TaxID=2765361 RepID=A0ABR7KSC6_9SPHI|nr:hypothetical protein [Pedobacter fastidiosus]MBC6110735.1 hypothetical protein [Pedobacter fastidiosus]